MTTPDGNDKHLPKPPAPPAPKPPVGGIPLAALWPKEEVVRGQPAAVSQQPPAAGQPKPAVAPRPATAPAKPVPPPAVVAPAPKPVAPLPAPVITSVVEKVDQEIPALKISPLPVVAAPQPKPAASVIAQQPAAVAAKAAATPPPAPAPSPELKITPAPLPLSKTRTPEQKPVIAAPKPTAAAPVPSPVPAPAKKIEKPRPPRKPAAPPQPEAKEQKPEVSQPQPEPAAPAETSTPALEQITEPAQQPGRPARPPLYIAMIASECAPVAKVGGLGDVVFGLSRELEIRGNSVEIFLPKYDCLRYDQIYDLQLTFKDLWVPWFNGAIHCSVYFGFVHGRKCFFIEPHSADNFFNRRMFYGQKDDDQRFAFFCRATLEFMLKSGKNPDIIHCHDWQTALMPVLLFEMYKFLGMTHPRACFTLHNLQHQGVTGTHILQATGLNRPEYFFHPDRLQDNFNRSAINLMKGGIVFSNFVTTVSPHYAWEIMNTNQDYGLGRTLHTHAVKIGGILNGLDYDTWNPEIDRHIPQMFGPAMPEKKYANKQALRQRFWLQDVFKPLVCYIGRLDHQKGVPLITHAINYTLQHGGQFVLLGTSPDAKISQHFWGLKRQYNDNPDCHIEIGFNEELSHLIYAGADMIIVPSLFEPCGLTQLIGLKYGTVPIVRAVGGLADTVFDANYSPKPAAERNGYVFNDFNAAGIESALSRAIGLWYNYPQHFRELMLNAMRCDYSWNHSGEHYLNVYDLIRDK
jgi:starch synthase